MNYACGRCGTTEPGDRTGYNALCDPCYHDACVKTAANDQIRRASADWMEAQRRHPAGKSARYRTSLLWRQCTCNTPSPCWHGGVEDL